LSKRKLVSLVLALIISAGVIAPRAVLGNRVLYNEPSAAAASTTPSPAAADISADETQPQPKHKGNGFARALSAPFRALAKLFGGDGKKPRAAEAKKSEPRPAPEADSTATVIVSQGVAREEANKGASTAQQEANAISRGIVSGARPGEGVRIVRPGEPAAPTPGVWIPFIKGIPGDPLSQGRALLEHGYIQEAIAELSTASSRVGPDLVEANNLLGLAYDRIGWHKQAAEAYQRALTFTPKDAVILANLGYSLYLADDYNGALKRLKQAAGLAPNTPVIRNNIGIVQARLGRYGDAYKSFARASNEYDAHLKLAGILETERRERDAITHYEAALRLQPGTSAVLERLVALYERTGQSDKADTARRTLGQPKNPQKTTTGGGD
jgi:Flp pilus assembly protein TadD